MKEMFAYPLIFSPEPEGGFTVTSPDFDGLITYGETVADSLYMASDALATIIFHKLQDNSVLPSPSDISEITAPNGGFVNYVWCDLSVFTNELSNRIKEVRTALEISRKELAERSGIAYTRITDIENGYYKLENVTVGTLFRIAKALTVSLDELCKE